MKRWIFENFGLKVLAVFMAFVLWAYVGSRQVLERRMTLHVELTDIPAGMAVDSSVRTSIPVLLTGRKDNLLDLDADDLKAVVSLKGFQPGQKQVVVHPKIQPLPDGVNVSVADLTVHLSPLALPKDPDGKKKKGKGN